ncbi:TetR/AcrR family transcriptional regulator [Brucepastera parasyntrophica]|uniref:TetR/AcrR family transcriptional regulator n=1 Tax=Brucepastera parasyntrophica TaxID=2880008 RepID=UPI00210B8D25|nr:TetR/AcrR family transcriptional regulator [Brucepastera parasyntrophica]ULQ59487.1 TetR/AcrR family transcriptional regulator [Brucepastera parasyntrophica]
MTTREKLLNASLDLFSVRGYRAVSIREIASAVGIRESAVYNHFTNKRNIMESLAAEAVKKIAEFSQSLHRRAVRHPEKKNTPGIRESYSRLALELFLFYTQDDFISKFRKLLTIEQFADPEAGNLYRGYFVGGVIKEQKQLFADFVKTGYFVPCDPETAAVQFYSPVFLFCSDYDTGGDGRMLQRKLKSHTEQFAKLYEKN